MTMSFLLHDSLNELDPADITMPSRLNASKKAVSPRIRVTVFEEKLQIPTIGTAVSRSRLLDLLDRSITQYGATLISGRAGTGKTTLAAGFTRRVKRSSWLTIEPADSDWREFSAAFSASLFRNVRGPSSTSTGAIDNEGISKYVTGMLGKLGKRKGKTPHLIVLDNVHYLFDAEWFGEFFRQFILSLDQNARLLMLCRSKPNAPLWRLRSKQMLNVIDENLLDLSEAEAFEIGKAMGATAGQAATAFKRSYGRVGTFLKYLSDPAR